MTETAAYYLTVSEAAGAADGVYGETIRVKGKIQAGTVDWDPDKLRLAFVIADEHGHLPVVYRGIVPDLFVEGRDVIVEGRLSPERLDAQTILASCPSKYEPQDGPGAH